MKVLNEGWSENSLAPCEATSLRAHQYLLAGKAIHHPSFQHPPSRGGGGGGGRPSWKHITNMKNGDFCLNSELLIRTFKWISPVNWFVLYWHWMVKYFLLNIWNKHPSTSQSSGISRVCVNDVYLLSLKTAVNKHGLTHRKLMVSVSIMRNGGLKLSLLQKYPSSCAV